MVGVWLAVKGSSVLWQQLEIGAAVSLVFMGWLSVLCGYVGGVLFESCLSVL